MDGIEKENEVTESVDRNILKDIGDGTGSDKVDSGMDDDSQHSNEPQEQGDDSDNEDEIVMRKPNKKRLMLLDEDDESSKDSVPVISEEKDSKTANRSDDDDNNDSGEDSNKEEDTLDKEQSALSQGTSSGTLFGNTDLFDAESDSDKGDNSDDNGDEKRNSGDDSGSDSNSDAEADDEGFDENSIDPKLLKKLKQGAAKRSPKKSKRQAKKEEMLKLHGETQRIIRESSVRLPYHQPSPKSLNDFLARANKKQQEYKMLKGGVRDLQKAKALQEILTKTKIVSQKQNTSETEDDPDYVPSLSKNKNDTNEQLETTDCEMKNDSANTDELKTSDQCDDQGDDDDDDDDDDSDSLPDLLVEPSTTSNKSHETNESNAISDKPSVTSNNLYESEKMELTENDTNDIKESVNLDDQELGNSANSELSVENKTRDNSNDTFNNKTNETSLENEKQQKEVNNTQLDSSQSHQENMDICDNETSLNCAKSSEQEEATASQDNVSRHLTPKLSGLPELNVLPRLSGGPDLFIDLDDEKEKNTPRNPGVSRLMDRLIKHSQKKKKHAKDVDISIIQKEKVTDKEELKMNTFTYHTEEDDENSLMKLETPGAKLLALKVQLKEKMKVKREEARQKRQEIFDLDNEEVYKDEDNAIEALDEEELSDRSDTDVEDEEFDEEFGDEEYEMEEEEKQTNPFVDGEASEDDEDYEPGADNSEDEDEMSLRLHLSDEDDGDDEEQEEKQDFKEKKVLSVKKRPRVLQISDDESSMSNIGDQEKSNTDSQKAEGGKENYNEEKDKEDDFTPFSRHLPSISPTQIKSKHSGLSLPIEDSMDLYGTTDNVPSTAIESSQSLNFYMEDSQSQMLDADGFLKVGSAVKPPRKISAIAQLKHSTNTQDSMDDFFGLCSGKFTSKETNNKSKTQSAFGGIGSNSTQDNMDELLGLCSGRFTDSQENKEQSCNKSLFTTNKDSNGKKNNVFDFVQSSKTQKNMEEFIGLCSGKFTTTDNSQTTTTQKSGVKRKSVFDEDEESNDSFKLLSDAEEEDRSNKDELSDNEDKEEKNALSDDDNDDGNDDDNFDEVDGDTKMRRSDDEEAEFRKPEKFKGFTIKNKHGKIRRDFVEEEAELSGSEFDSDENYDIAEDEDILEMEEGDKDVQMPESELRDQVGRVHLKQLIDEDKRELLRFQEMYLPDGDLHSEGGGRTRKFRWKDMDDDTQQDMFNDSDAEKEEEENENDYNWRKERFEREKWLQENQENEMMDEGSQFLKLGKVFFKRQNSESQSQNITLQQPKSTNDKKKESSPTPKLFKLTAKQKRGSFLSRDKQTLAKIAETTKSDLKVNGAKNSKNFVFTVVSPDKDKEMESESMPAPTERKVRKALQPTHKQPPAKKRKIEVDTSSQNSIFNHI